MGFTPKHANTSKGSNIARGLTRKGGLFTDKGKRASGVKKGAKGRGGRENLRDGYSGKGGAADGLDRWG